jgi:hypothetical protein
VAINALGVTKLSLSPALAPSGMVTSKVAGFFEPFFLLDYFLLLDEPLPPSATTAADSSSAPSSSSAPTRLCGRILTDPPHRAPAAAATASAPTALTAPQRILTALRAAQPAALNPSGPV